jgi:hypothetical protein
MSDYSCIIHVLNRADTHNQGGEGVRDEKEKKRGEGEKGGGEYEEERRGRA